jgi:hypothetical protein
MPRPKAYQSGGIRCDECNDLQINGDYKAYCGRFPDVELVLARRRCGKPYGILIPSNDPKILRTLRGKTMHSIVADSKVPKKYRKYAAKVPDKQLFLVGPVEMTVPEVCCDCGKTIPANEEFMQLMFREPSSPVKRTYIALCKNCAKL